MFYHSKSLGDSEATFISLLSFISLCRLSLSLSVSLSLCLSLSGCLSGCRSVVSLWLSLCRLSFVSLSVPLSLYLSFLSLSVSHSLSVVFLSLSLCLLTFFLSLSLSLTVPLSPVGAGGRNFHVPTLKDCCTKTIKAS